MADLRQSVSKVSSILNLFRPLFDLEAELQALLQDEVSAEGIEKRAIDANQALTKAKDEFLKVSAEIELKRRNAEADHQRCQADRQNAGQATEAMWKDRVQKIETAYAAREKELSQRTDIYQAAVNALRDEQAQLTVEVEQLRAVRDNLKSQLAQGASGAA